MVATLEWAAHVRTAPMSSVNSGSPVIAAKSSRTTGACSTGARLLSRLCRESSISPSPIATRPRSLTMVCVPRLKATTPVTSRSGATAEESKESNCTIRVVPTFAPSMTASAGTRSTKPDAENELSINAVAVLLCKMAVTPTPAVKAWNLLFNTLPRKCLILAPKARTMPLCTM